MAHRARKGHGNHSSQVRFPRPGSPDGVTLLTCVARDAPRGGEAILFSPAYSWGAIRDPRSQRHSRWAGTEASREWTWSRVALARSQYSGLPGLARSRSVSTSGSWSGPMSLARARMSAARWGVSDPTWLANALARWILNRPGFVRGSQVPRRRVPVRGGCDGRSPRVRRAGSCRSRRAVAGG